METNVKLTKLASCAGCGAKVGAGVLAKLLANFGVTEPEAQHIDMLQRIVLSENPSAWGEFPGNVIIGICPNGTGFRCSAFVFSSDLDVSSFASCAASATEAVVQNRRSRIFRVAVMAVSPGLEMKADELSFPRRPRNRLRVGRSGALCRRERDRSWNSSVPWRLSSVRRP